MIATIGAILGATVGAILELTVEQTDFDAITGPTVRSDAGRSAIADYQ